jgi:hypothetical protein
MFEFVRGERDKARDESELDRSNGSGIPDESAIDSAEATRAPRVATRITVSLAAKAADDLQRIVIRTHLSHTDIVNRAVSMYEFIDSELAEGAELIVRKDGKDHVVRLL